MENDIQSTAKFNDQLDISKGPRQGRGTGQQELHELQQGQMQSPAPEKEEPLATGQAEDWLAGKQLCGKEPGGLGRQRGERGLALCLGRKGQRRPGLREQESKGNRQSKEVIPLTPTCETTPTIPHPVLGPPIQEIHQQTEGSSVASHRDGQGWSSCSVWRLRELGWFSLQKEWFLEGPNSSLPVPTGSYQEDKARLFTVVHGGRTRGHGGGDKRQWTKLKSEVLTG